ncbi:MAG: hypothetical protein ACD_30C00040G0001 [uncultured bacterium]|nr:MAG: hypothetical protein ACD_30C00040G0001 [uncultured bacterium]
MGKVCAPLGPYWAITLASGTVWSYFRATLSPPGVSNLYISFSSSPYLPVKVSSNSKVGVSSGSKPNF